jgi:cell division protein FtsI/penicillin-binding protein 2
VVGLHETIDCVDGYWFAGRRRINDFHASHRHLDPSEVIIKSSNVGISKIVLRMVPEDVRMGSLAFKSIRDTLLLLGFGKRPGVLAESQETKGKVYDLSDWSRNYTLASISFGREIAVSPIQLAAAYCAVANDGMYVPPRLIERMESPGGREIRPPLQPACRVFSAETCKNVREMLARVVEEGSGKKAQIPGVRVGGKTGTAEKLPARTEVTASFVALAPVERPTLVVLVVVDEPKGAHLASKVAAPHVKAILERSLSHLNAFRNNEIDYAGER